MIFKQHQKVLNGTKTQARRIMRVDGNVWLEGISFSDGIINEVHGVNGVRFYVGQLLPVIPKRGQKAIRDERGNIRRVKVIEIRNQPLQEISDADAKAEGVENVAAYRELWDSINKAKGTRWEDNPLVWALTFQLEHSESDV